MEEKFNNVDILEVKVGEFKQDYANLKLEKEKVRAEKMLEFDARVEAEIEAMRLVIADKVKTMIDEEIDNEFDSKISFYEKYFFVPILEVNEEITNVEEEIPSVEVLDSTADTVLI